MCKFFWVALWEKVVNHVLTIYSWSKVMIASKLFSRTFLRCQSTAAAAAIAYNSKNVPVHQTKVLVQ